MYCPAQPNSCKRLWSSSTGWCSNILCTVHSWLESVNHAVQIHCEWFLLIWSLICPCDLFWNTAIILCATRYLIFTFLGCIQTLIVYYPPNLQNSSLWGLTKSSRGQICITQAMLHPLFPLWKLWLTCEDRNGFMMQHLYDMFASWLWGPTFLQHMNVMYDSLT